MVRPDRADKPIDAIGVRPVALYRHGGDSPLRDQTLSDRRTLTVELMGAVRRLTHEDESGSCRSLYQRVVVCRRAGERRTSSGWVITANCS